MRQKDRGWGLGAGCLLIGMCLATFLLSMYREQARTNYFVSVPTSVRSTQVYWPPSGDRRGGWRVKVLYTFDYQGKEFTSKQVTTLDDFEFVGLLKSSAELRKREIDSLPSVAFVDPADPGHSVLLPGLKAWMTWGILPAFGVVLLGIADLLRFWRECFAWDKNGSMTRLAELLYWSLAPPALILFCYGPVELFLLDPVFGRPQDVAVYVVAALAIAAFALGIAIMAWRQRVNPAALTITLDTP